MPGACYSSLGKIITCSKRVGEEEIKHQDKAVPGLSSKKLNRRGFNMGMSEVEWGMFKDCWTRYTGMTVLMEVEGIRDELRES